MKAGSQQRQPLTLSKNGELRGERYTGGMLAPEFIVFSTLFAIPLVWTLLKILVNHLIDSEPPPINVEGQLEAVEDRHHQRAA
jgi:hypothetical protein